MRECHERINARHEFAVSAFRAACPAFAGVPAYLFGTGLQGYPFFNEIALWEGAGCGFA
jgi:hypothetical protein